MYYWITDEYVRASVAERTPRHIPDYVAPTRRRGSEASGLRRLLVDVLLGVRDGLIGAPVIVPSAP